MKSGFLMCLLCLMVACAASPATLPAFSSKQTTPKVRPDPTARMEALLKQYISAQGPGAAMLVLKNGQQLYGTGRGRANLKTGAPIGLDTAFYLASVSKQFTAMAIMMLAEEGKLGYRDPLTRYFPQFPAYAKKITIEHLLHHTGGLSDYIENFDPDALGDGPITRAVIDQLALQPEPDFPAGSRYEYSNSGYVVLAGIVEVASGQTYPEFLQKRIFNPLGMSRTSVIDDRALLPPFLAHAYKAKNGGYQDVNFGDDRFELVYGDGGVLSTVADLARWDAALDSAQLVSPTTLERAFTSGTLNSGKSIDYGYGWEITRFKGVRLIEHEGYWNGWNTTISRFPDQKLTVVVLANLDDFPAGEVAHRVAALYLEKN
ncbi:MAG: beta-lactamase family protein [Blastocatellia bacterium]|nr:beta-lactamase family protein [Blastocatellia bacterium]